LSQLAYVNGASQTTIKLVDINRKRKNRLLQPIAIVQRRMRSGHAHLSVRF